VVGVKNVLEEVDDVGKVVLLVGTGKVRENVVPGPGEVVVPTPPDVVVPTPPLEEVVEAVVVGPAVPVKLVELVGAGNVREMVDVAAVVVVGETVILVLVVEASVAVALVEAALEVAPLVVVASLVVVIGALVVVAGALVDVVVVVVVPLVQTSHTMVVFSGIPRVLISGLVGQHVPGTVVFNLPRVKANASSGELTHPALQSGVPLHKKGIAPLPSVEHSYNTAKLSAPESKMKHFPPLGFSIPGIV
jgi:hypothetical protein